jgi:hypothetical protein
MWDFRNQSTQDTKGANTAAGFVAGYQPFNQADTLSSKRNVVATDKGWVRRQNYTDVHGTVRVKEEVLVAAHPGGASGYESAAYLGSPDISILQTDKDAYTTSETVTLYVTFNEPLVVNANVDIVLTERGGATSSFTSNTTNDPGTSVAKFYEYGANNTLVFVGGPLAAGNWKVMSQTLSTLGTVLSWNTDGEAADLAVQAPVSNTLMSSTGSVFANGEFTVA